MKNLTIAILAFLALSTILNTPVWSQSTSIDSGERKFYAGSSLFILGNLASTNKPDFVQLNFGYRLSPKHVVGIEFITWKYAWPLGIPYGPDFEAPEYEYPGYVREYGIALVYQHFWWKGLYSSVHAMNALKTYVDENDEKIQNGYKLFLTYRLVGYHIPLFKNRAFLEPSVAITHWPVSTNTPESFQAVEADWPNYFLFEPGLHFGFKF